MKFKKGKNYIVYSDCIELLWEVPERSISMIYIDPPFNTGKILRKESYKMQEDPTSKRKGFMGKTYKATKVSSLSYDDRNEKYFHHLHNVIALSKRVLKDDGSFFLHLDYRSIHRAKLICDEIFGAQHFKNEIIWAFDFGGKPKNKWPAKHNNILWYTKSIKDYTFNYDEIDRIPYMSPLLVGKQKAAIGKIPTDVFWGTIVGTNAKEKTEYPTQKPEWLLRRLVAVHSNPGDRVLDCFAGSGTLGAVAGQLKRPFVIGDTNPEAVAICKQRLVDYSPVVITFPPKHKTASSRKTK